MKLSLSRPEGVGIEWIDRNVEGTLTRIAQTLGHSRATIDLVVVDDPYIQRLNRKYRGLDRPTDVLSFSYERGERSEPGAPDDPAGEIYVSYQAVERDAAAQGVDARTLFVRLGVHGMLHLIGFEHDSDADAQAMEARERGILLEHLALADVDKLF